MSFSVSSLISELSTIGKFLYFFKCNVLFDNICDTVLIQLIKLHPQVKNRFRVQQRGSISWQLKYLGGQKLRALAAYNGLGRSNKNKADEATVEIMRTIINKVDSRGEIVIGEWEIDEASMLYIEEKVGSGRSSEVDIAVDPIGWYTDDGNETQNNTVSVIAVSEKCGLLKAPDMYMEQLAVVFKFR